MGLVAFIVGRFNRLLNSPCRLTGADGRRLSPAEVGRLGEDIAVAWLRAKGIKVLRRNFRAPGGGEVDIVAREGKVLLFIEVKTRRSRKMGSALGAIDDAKRKLIRRGGKEWLRLLGRRDFAWRYDLIEILLFDGERPEVARVENLSPRRQRDDGGMPPQNLSATL